MRNVLFSIAASALAACAAGMQRPPDTSIEEAEVFIEATSPEIVQVLRHRKPLHYDYVNDKFVLLEEKDGTYLIEFRHVCDDLSADTVVIELVYQRARQGLLRSKLDTIRGCLIQEIYKLPQSKSDERLDREDTNRSNDTRDEQQDDAEE